MATAVVDAPALATLAPPARPACEIRVGRVQHLHDGWYVDGVGPMSPEQAEQTLDWLDKKRLEAGPQQQVQGV